MDVFINQFSHVNKSVLPLRFGLCITQTHQSFAKLNNEVFDPIGTDRQRGDEKDRGNQHFLGTLLIKKENKNHGYYECKGRFVIAPPPPERDLNRVVTALLDDITNLKNDIATTKHLEGMLKRNRITTEEIIQYLHPFYLHGKVRDSNDIEEILSSEVIPGRDKLETPKSSSDQMIIDSGDEIIETIDGFGSSETDELEPEVVGPLLFEPLKLKPSIKYSYVMADAYVIDAGRNANRVWVKIINSKGNEQTLESFSARSHLMEHHDKTAKYLSSRIGQRAFMAICVSDNYNGVLAESVTSIALDLMKERR